MRVIRPAAVISAWLVLSFMALVNGRYCHAAVDARMIKARQMQKQRVQQQLAAQIHQQQAAAIAQQNAPGQVIPQKLQYLDIKAVSRNSGAQDQDSERIKEAFRNSSLLWNDASEQQKEEIVWCFINEFRQNGVEIRKPSSHYVSMIDGMRGQNPDLLKQPFSTVLQFMAVIEYDFGNGQDKDAMARKILGEEGYSRNKRRLSSGG